MHGAHSDFNQIHPVVCKVLYPSKKMEPVRKSVCQDGFVYGGGLAE